MANPLQVVTYANCTFQNPTLSVDATALYDDAGLSQIGTRYKFTVTGVMGGVSQTDLANQICLMKQATYLPRGTFSVVWTGDGGPTTLYSTDATQDIAFGPHPGSLTLFKHAGGRAASYNWSITTDLKDCSTGISTCAPGGRMGQILSLTQTFDFSINEDGFTRRTINGRLLVTSDAVPAHSWAAAILPMFPQPKGFQRVQQTFSQSADARTLTYSIVDQEVMWTLPAPITGGNASFSVKIDPYGAKQTYTLRGRYSAPASVGKNVLVSAALLLAAQKIPGIAGSGATVIPVITELTESVYENSIDFYFEAWSATFADLSTFGGVPAGTSSDNTGQFVGPYGGTGSGGSNSGIIAGSPYIADGCKALIAGSLPTQSESPPPTQVPSPTNGNNPVDTPPGDLASYSPPSDEQQAAMWLDYHEEVTFHVKNNIRKFMPKKAGAAPIFQQTAPPEITVVQRGYAVRVANTANLKSDPVFPPPTLFFNSSQAQLLDSDYTMSNGDQLGISDYDKYTIRWCFTMQINTAVSTINISGLGFPDDPRRSYKGPLVNNLPELVDQAPPTQA
jgi:hypothetical protein